MKATIYLLGLLLCFSSSVVGQHKPTPVRPTPGSTTPVSPTPTPTPQKPSAKKKKKDTFIQIDGKDEVALDFQYSGGQRFFNISTNANSWSTWGVPSWCSIKNKTATSFDLEVTPNTSVSARADYFEIRTPKGHSARISITQKGLSGPVARVENITVDHSQILEDGKGMIIHVKFNIQNMKGKKGKVVAYFYEDDGKALIDTNGKYLSSDSHVSVGKDIIPSSDDMYYSDLTLSIPYSELHQTGSGSRILKFSIWVWDMSVSPAKSLYKGEPWYRFTFTSGTDTTLMVDGSNSDKTKHFPESGGRETYFVSTSSSSYETWGVPSWCSIENKTSTSFTLVCSRNTSSSPRSDYMKVKSAGKEIRIDITQDAKLAPSAEIESVSQEHNVYNGSVKGMNIKLKFKTHNMLNQRVTATAWFYYGDNTTKLNNGYGGQVNVSNTDTAPYENTEFTMTLFMPYTNLRMTDSGSTTLSFDVVITDFSGNSLVRSNNHAFVYSQ